MNRWGLLPYWAKDEKLSYSTFNARAEEFRTKPAFRDAWKRGQRCLVVTDGFYEWKKLDPKGKVKQPFAIAMAAKSFGRRYYTVSRCDTPQPKHSKTATSGNPSNREIRLASRMSCAQLGHRGSVSAELGTF